jgi:hypothetical protein
MGRVRLPSPAEVETVKNWLGEATMLHIDGVRFERAASGIRMVAHYRGLKGHTQKKTITAPDTDDYTDVVVHMAHFLERGEQVSFAPPMAVH